jgi:hypothetical protein
MANNAHMTPIKTIPARVRPSMANRLAWSDMYSRLMAHDAAASNRTAIVVMTT